jgi:sugar/nucleoside kinase (ribokinase family)
MSLLVTGSIGIDTVTTPYGRRDNCLGGSAVYFSMAASFFCPVRLVGVVGSDCPVNLNEFFAGRDVDLRGLEVRGMSRTFRWKGSYHDTASDAITENIELNVLSEQPPKVPDEFKDSSFVFLANTAPALQIELLERIEKPAFVAADTMNCWIDGRRDDLKKLLERIDCLIINAEEAKALAKEGNLIKAADVILQMGPRIVIIKKGESGSVMCESDEWHEQSSAGSGAKKFLLPAFPAANVKDPTGAGDSFAGGFMGRLASTGKSDTQSLKEAIAYGTVLASFAISEFSLEGLEKIRRPDIDKRF